MILISFSIP